MADSSPSCTGTFSSMPPLPVLPVPSMLPVLPMCPVPPVFPVLPAIPVPPMLPMPSVWPGIAPVAAGIRSGMAPRTFFRYGPHWRTDSLPPTLDHCRASFTAACASTPPKP